MVSNEYAERIARLEVQVSDLSKNLLNIDKKLDDLIALRYKGVGAFWLASSILGTGIVGAVFELFRYWSK